MSKVLSSSVRTYTFIYIFIYSSKEKYFFNSFNIHYILVIQYSHILNYNLEWEHKIASILLVNVGITFVIVILFNIFIYLFSFYLFIII